MALGVERLGLFLDVVLIDWWLLLSCKFEMGFLDVLTTFLLELCT